MNRICALRKRFSYYITTIGYSFRHTAFQNTKDSIVRKDYVKGIRMSSILVKVLEVILFVAYLNIQQRLIEIDEKGLKKYLDLVIREVKKVDKNSQ